jgi:hypothetical protein
MKIESKTLRYIILVIIIIFIFVMALISRFCAKDNGSANRILSEPAATQTVNAISYGSIIKNKIFFPFLSSDNLVYYLSDKGIIFYNFNPVSQEIKKIWPNEVLGAYNVVFKKDASKAVIQSTYPNVNVSSIDFQNQKSYTLSDKIQSLVWANDKIIYHYLDANNKINNISISDPDGSNWQEIVAIDLNRPKLIVSPDTQEVLLIPTPVAERDDERVENIYLLNINTKNISQLTTDGYIPDASWSPNGSKILYYQWDKNVVKLTLGIMDKATKEKKDLGIQTNLNEAIWQDDQHVIVAVPQTNSDTNAVGVVNYEFYIVDINSNITTKLQLPSPGYIEDVKNMMYDSKDKILYFTSKDMLYKITIK